MNQALKPVLCAGEILYDFISRDRMQGLGGTTLFEKRPGGAPFNIAAGLQKLGVPTAFLSKIGFDEFGEALVKYLNELGIRTNYIVRETGTKTTLAFAALDSDGKPEFRFYRDRAADISLRKDELKDLSHEDFSLFHFGSIALLDEPSASTYIDLFERFKKAGVRTSFDPNVRKNAVVDHDTFRRKLREIMRRVDILKLSDEDLEYIAGKGDVEKAVESLGVGRDELVLVTLGSKGARAFWRGRFIGEEGFKVEVAETTGCGDSFMAAVISRLYSLSDERFKALDFETLGGILRFANAGAAIVATRYGAANAMPSGSEIGEFLQSHRR